MAFYSSYAKGLWLLDGNTVTDAEKLRGQFDFVIIHAGIGDKPSIKFTEHYEAVKNLNIPVLGYVEADGEISVGWTYNPDVWPDAAHDPTCNMLYRRTKYPNGTQRLIHGWVVDGSKHTQTDKKELGDNWVTGIFRHTVDRVFKRFGKPVYPLIKKSTVSFFPAGSALETLLGNWSSISTYEPATKPVMTGFGSAYIPGDMDAIQQPHSGTWDLWWYGSAPIPGVTGAVVLFLYNGTPTKLYNEVSFKPATLPTPPPPTTDPADPKPTDPGTTPVPADLGGKIDALTLAVSVLAQAITTLTNMIKPFFSKF